MYIKLLSDADQESYVKKYQETGDESYFEVLFEGNREKIKNKVYAILRQHKVSKDDLKQALELEFWTACKVWDSARGIPFVKYVSVVFNRESDHFVDNYFRKEMTYREHNCSLDEKIEAGFDLFDASQEIESYLMDEEDSQGLVNYLDEQVGNAAEVAVLKAKGYENIKIAELMGFLPDAKHLRDTQRQWTERKLESCQQPALNYYYYVLDEETLPITLVA